MARGLAFRVDSGKDRGKDKAKQPDKKRDEDGGFRPGRISCCIFGYVVEYVPVWMFKRIMLRNVFQRV